MHAAKRSRAVRPVPVKRVHYPAARGDDEEADSAQSTRQHRNWEGVWAVVDAAVDELHRALERHRPDYTGAVYVEITDPTQSMHTHASYVDGVLHGLQARHAHGPDLRGTVTVRATCGRDSTLLMPNHSLDGAAANLAREGHELGWVVEVYA